jgi:hypothetical protein
MTNNRNLFWKNKLRLYRVLHPELAAGAIMCELCPWFPHLPCPNNRMVMVINSIGGGGEGKVKFVSLKTIQRRNQGVPCQNRKMVRTVIGTDYFYYVEAKKAWNRFTWKGSWTCCEWIKHT